MNYLGNIFFLICCIAANFFIFATVLLFLRGFYDSGFQWNRKKAMFILLISIVMGVIDYFTVRVSLLVTFINALLLPVYVYAAAYDYQGKKIWGIIRFYVVYQIISYVMYTPLLSAAVVANGGSYIDSFNQIIYSNTIDMESIGLYFAETQKMYQQVMPYLTVLFCLVFLLLYYKVYKPGILVRLKKRHIVLTIVYVEGMPILAGVILGIRIFSDAAYVAILEGIAIAACVSLPILLYNSRIQAYYRERTRIQESYIESELEHFRKYKQAQEETKIFRHDIRNNLQCMHQMLSTGKVKDAENYLSELLESVETLSDKYVSGDEILDCILSAKVAEMEKKHIVFTMDGVLAGGLAWKPVDICGVFANALDNAIEACLRLPAEERHIHFEIKTTSQYWFIRICNPVHQKVDIDHLFKKEGGYTSKEKAENHGIGTYKMKYTVESYGGILNAECTDQQFTLEIALDKTLSYQLT